MALREHKIPYAISGGQSFFDRAEIKDVLAYLRLLVNPDDDPAFIRAVTTPKRGIGNVTLERLGSHAGERHVSLFAACREVSFAERVPAAQREGLAEFAGFVERMAAPCASRRGAVAGNAGCHPVRTLAL